jgi:Patatin-like phospholipase
METLEVLSTEAIISEEYKALDLSESIGEPAALCLSGGGIRSAAFCLGALQSFARKHLLHEFHYLSTVSGGGYIGGWLTRCIAAQADQGISQNGRLLERPKCSVEMAEDEILKDNWTPAIDTLRAYTNYLTPHSGLASGDTWATVVLWLRNTLINWAVIVPLLLLATSLPIIYLSLVCHLVASPGWWPVAGSVITGTAGLCCLTLAIYRGCIDLPSHMHPDCDWTQTKKSDFGLTGREVFRKIVILALAWAFLVPVSFAPVIRPTGEPFPGLTVSATLVLGQDTWWVLAILPAFYCVACLIAYLLAWRHVVFGYNYQCPKNRDAHKAAFRDNFWAWTCSSAFSAVVLYIGSSLAEGQSVLWISLAGPIWVIIAEILRSAAYVAVRTEGIRTDLDREWLARLNADKLRYVFAFGLAGTSAIFLPELILGHPDRVWAWIATAVGLLSGPAAAMLGKSANIAFLRSGKEGTQTPWLRSDWVIGVAVSLFAAALFMLFGRLSAVIVCALVHSAAPSV